jgi:hypothetical protein
MNMNIKKSVLDDSKIDPDTNMCACTDAEALIKANNE